MTFEGTQLQGAVKIMEKLNSLTFQKINRIITAVDSQPMFDGGVLINVLGRLQADEDPPHAYSQVFVLKPLGNSFFVQHDIFRLGIHDTAWDSTSSKNPLMQSHFAMPLLFAFYSKKILCVDFLHSLLS